ncbi:hypothetical protein B296_00016839 [Ensete ventricosum]|uniref:Uncharacterized protein n=1 Tax=Ensete ventricosum TaxID=4639 RepID=A0A427B2V6_ENSVE|nr:hypothetical protein B296_00016839 [Ensete ventricosum]
MKNFLPALYHVLTNLDFKFSWQIKFRRGLPPGDGVLFYPGEVFSPSHEPIASIRLERILSGMQLPLRSKLLQIFVNCSLSGLVHNLAFMVQDIEYLKLYSSRYGREEGLALLEKTGAYLSPERYTLEHTPIDLMRAEIYRTCGA